MPSAAALVGWNLWEEEVFQSFQVSEHETEFFILLIRGKKTPKNIKKKGKRLEGCEFYSVCGSGALWGSNSGQL